MSKYDLLVIGAGPGGYVAAIRAAQLGQNVALVDKRETLGGTCLNVGCIPSKALLDSTEHYHQAKEKFSLHGIGVGELSVDIEQMMKRKDAVVSQTCAGIKFLMEKNKIKVYCGTAQFKDSNTVEISGRDNETVSASNILIATGSEPTPLPFAAFDGERIISSDEAINLQEIPKEIVIIGGGVIGLELGSVYARLGTLVHVVEFLDGILPTMDREIGRQLQRSLKKLGIKFYLNTGVTEIIADKKSVLVRAKNNKKDEAIEFNADYALVCIGRRPYLENLGLENTKVNLDEHGRVKTNSVFLTEDASIYAIGDAIAGPMLAHKAEEEGVAVAEILDGQHSHIDYNLIPGVVYTWPEAASVGQTEEQLKEKGIAYKKGSFPFKASGRARASEETDGFVKVLADEKTDEILGVHMLGPRCADMIAEAVVAMEYKASAEDIARICHAHPTYTESLKEAALMATAQRALHM